jgi:hypothetical protein
MKMVKFVKKIHQKSSSKKFDKKTHKKNSFKNSSIKSFKKIVKEKSSKLFVKFVKSPPFVSHQSRFLEVPLVLQADGELKNSTDLKML